MSEVTQTLKSFESADRFKIWRRGTELFPDMVDRVV